MTGQIVTNSTQGEPFKCYICQRCKEMYLDNQTLCARCSQSLTHYLSVHQRKPPDWFVKKLSQLLNADNILRWCPRCHTLHEGASQLCDECAQQLNLDKLQHWIQKVRRKRLSGMKSGSHVSDKNSYV